MKVIVLAGGSGSRLWPLSRSQYPKQFLTFGSGGSLLQKTVTRFYPEVPVEDLLIITNPEYLHVVHAQLEKVHPQLKERVILEPMGKNTGPAVALAIRALEEKWGVAGDEPVLISSADHIIAPKEKFLETVHQAAAFAKKGKIITFGVRPTRPETGYGYIKAVSKDLHGPFDIQEFIEKPPLKQASAFVESGEYYWNAGMFLFTPDVLWQECAACTSTLAAFKEKSLQENTTDFSQTLSISFDCAIMEKTVHGAVMPLDLTWSDIGSWDSVHEVLDKDEQQNVAIGNVHAIETKNSLLIGGERLISTLGIEDMLVIDTEDALFIAKKGESQKVKTLVEAFRAKGMKEVVEHRQVHRPWGSYTVLEESDRYKIKRIVVHPGARLSLQLHYHRSEHWIVVQGTAEVTIGDQEQLVHENESVYVPKSAVHRLGNPGKVSLEMIEVQVGEYVGEDDIVRLEDIYGRVAEV